MLSFYNSARSCIDTFPKNLEELAIKHGQDLSKFWISPVLSYLIEEKINDPKYIDGKLNKTSNVYGFNLRRRNGQRAAQKLLSAIKKIHASKHQTIDKLDIVAHSMGYAYALGMVDILKGKVPLGRFYIIAPENAEAGEINLNDFEEVWQYGSNLGEPNADPLHQQDGVASQTPVRGLKEIKDPIREKRGRAFIPDGEPKGFLQSHSIGNYKWIFKIENATLKGYVKPRK